MKLKRVALWLLLAFIAEGFVPLQDTVSLDIIDEEGKETRYEFAWPFSGPPPIGSKQGLLTKVEKILNENKIDCPPTRVKISDNIWKCGNGKKIRTKDAKLGRLLSAAWD